MKTAISQHDTSFALLNDDAVAAANQTTRKAKQIPKTSAAGHAAEVAVVLVVGSSLVFNRPSHAAKGIDLGLRLRVDVESLWIVEEKGVVLIFIMIFNMASTFIF